MMSRHILLVFLMGVVCQLSRPVLGHARFWEPPSRSTMWRRGYPTPINYNDNQLFCGGFSHQVNQGYKCGTCGDPYDGVRENEAGGKYATGKITRTYSQGQEVTFQVDVTANHKGFFEFKICATNDPNKKADQYCLDQNVLELADGSGTRFTLPQGSMMMDVNVRLPAGLTCDFCVIQMRYHAGNSWGKDKGASQGCLGCGYQEEFYGCADVRILPAGSPLPGNDGSSGGSGGSGSSGSGSTTRSTPSGGGSGSGSSGSGGSGSSGSSTSTRSTPSGGGSSGGSGSGGSGPSGPSGSSGDQVVCYTLSAIASDQWCQLNCQAGYCPSNLCRCEVGQFPHSESRPAGCRAAGAYASVPGYDDWCRSNCSLGNCPASICVC